MSNITCTCPHCQSQMNFSSAAVGQQVNCSGCQQTVMIKPDAPPALAWTDHALENRAIPPAKKKMIIFAAIGASAVGLVILCIIGGVFFFLNPQEDGSGDGRQSRQSGGSGSSEEFTNNPNSHRRLTKVRGVLTYDGRPLANATISIMPDGGDGTSKPADGKTGADGNFSLGTTFPDGERVEGAVEGMYTLRVVKYQERDILTDQGGPPVDGADPTSEMMDMMGDDLNTSSKSLINEKFGLAYSVGKNWDNKCTVGTIGSRTTFNIILNSDGRGRIVALAE